jgi:hypothetical protein
VTDQTGDIIETVAIARGPYRAELITLGAALRVLQVPDGTAREPMWCSASRISMHIAGRRASMAQ